MIGKVTLIAGLFAVGTALGSLGASAAPALPQSKPADGSLLLQAKYYGHHHHHHHRGGRIILGLGGYGYGYGYGYSYCGGWRSECGARWGYGTRGFYRCLWRHGC